MVVLVLLATFRPILSFFVLFRTHMLHKVSHLAHLKHHPTFSSCFCEDRGIFGSFGSREQESPKRKFTRHLAATKCSAVNYLKDPQGRNLDLRPFDGFCVLVAGFCARFARWLWCQKNMHKQHRVLVLVNLFCSFLPFLSWSTHFGYVMMCKSRGWSVPENKEQCRVQEPSIRATKVAMVDKTSKYIKIGRFG